MSRRHTVCDFANQELYAGDLIISGSRNGNRVRLAEYIIVKVTTERAAGRVFPLLHVVPTGVESGFVARRSSRVEHISNEHAYLVHAGYAEVEKGKVIAIQGVPVNA